MKKAYCPYCGEPLENGCDCERILTEVDRQWEEWMDEYESRLDVNYGWHQQDIIDMYRRER